MDWNLLTLLLLSYYIGGIPVGYIIAKLVSDKDITKVGSGNIGATNIYRLLGWRWAIAVFVLDALKGAFPVALALILYPPSVPFVAVITFVGNIFSPYLGLRGGKGVGTGSGILLVLYPLPTILALITGLLLIKITRLVSLSSLITASALFTYLILFASQGVQRISLGILLLLVLFAHRSNIRRLITQEEKPIERIKPSRTHSNSNKNQIRIPPQQHTPSRTKKTKSK